MLRQTVQFYSAVYIFAEMGVFFCHPLCTVVHNDLRKEISAAIDRGERKIQNVWQQVKAARVRFADKTAFFNINSLTDLHEWQKNKNEKENLY